jgi:hypothetical protein
MIGPLEAFAAHWRADTSELAMEAAMADVAARAQLGPAPVRLSAAGRALGAELRPASVPGCGLVLDGEHAVVLVPRSPWRTWRRARFGVGHELAHLAIARTPGVDRAALRDPRAHRPLERLCDLGAAALLMPAPQFAADALREGIGADRLRSLYDTYLVSWMSLMNRLSTVLPDTGVSLWRFGARAGDDPALARVVSSWGWSRSTFLPRGISEHKLSRLMITTAFHEGWSATSDLRLLHLSDRPSVSSVACTMPAFSRDQEVLPVLDGFRVPDEERAYAHVALLQFAGAHRDRLAERAMHGAVRPRAASRQSPRDWLVPQA